MWGGYVRCQRREKNLRLKHWRGWFKQGRRSLLVIMRERIYDNNSVDETDKIAKEAGAVYHIKRRVLVNTEIVDQYLEAFRDDPI